MDKKLIMIFSDQELTMFLLEKFLREHSFEIALASNNIWQIVAEIPNYPLSGMLIEARRKSLNGMKELSVIKSEYPELPTAVLSASTSPNYVMNALNLGADGYLLKNTMSDDFVKDLESVCNGNICISRELVGTVFRSMRNNGRLDSKEFSFQLTPREHEIMALMSNGATNRQIAQYTSLSINTINNHIASIYKKLGTHNRINAVSIWEGVFRSGEKG